MLPVNSIFPKFVPDQLLTSDDLNQLFGYLDEQGRMTRTNLIGIGIVCGLEIQTNGTGTAITITKGCGVTSEGYLVTVPDNTYTEYFDFDPVKERYYDKFVNIGTKTKKFNLWELTKAGVVEGSINLNAGFLADKIVLIFVELKEEGNKNCDPNSCDDKGVEVTVTFRPLLVAKADAGALLGVVSTTPGINTFKLLPEIRFRRYDVPFTFLIDTSKIFGAYLELFKNPFLSNLQTSLTQSYNVLLPFVGDEFASNPFSNLANNFSFLANGSITPAQLLNLQYYYDLFSDIIQAYHELRAVGAELLSICCPDSGLFPRHLLLGEAIGYSSSIKSSFRHYFIPSPALSQHGELTGKLHFLFKKLVLLTQNFQVPAVQVAVDTSNRLLDKNIRITPSKLGDIKLSEKAIPYYYLVNELPSPLYKSWNYQRTLTDTAQRNLSYHAEKYNTSDDEIKRPLLYELEPYNFFRIEGHIGKPFLPVLRQLQFTKIIHRLPFDVVALNADLRALLRKLIALRTSTAATLAQALNIDPDKVKCHFNDLEALYDATVAEITCCLCKEMKFFYNIEDDDNRITLPPLTDPVPKAQLLVKCDPAFRITQNTLGQRFEIFYAAIANQPYIFPQSLLALLGNNNKDPKVFALMLLYYMEKTYEVLTDKLETFDIADFTLRHGHLLFVAQTLKAEIKKLNAETGADSFFVEDILDHIDAIIYCCQDARFKSIYQEYLSRWLHLMFVQSFGYYAALNPGITHKAGVPVGGTFILVYHQKEPQVTFTTGAILNRDVSNAFLATSDQAGATINTSTAKSSKKKKAATDAETLSVNTNADALTNAANLTYQAAFDNVVRKLGVERLSLSVNILGALDSDTPNASLDELITEIADGVVIADFYVPYICCSDCPPVQFIIPDIQQPEKLTLSLEPEKTTNTNVYCSNDEHAYAFKVSPDGGDINPKEGVEKRADGIFVFTPAKVAIGNNAALTFNFVYSKDGQSSPAVTAVVNHIPVAAFNAPATSTSTVVVFTNQSQFADTYEWDFGDGKKDTAQNPTHDFTKDGTYTVTLKASKGICSNSITQTITVKVPVQKTCLPLTSVVEEFNALKNVEPNRFDPFTNIFQSYKDVEAFFKDMGLILTQPLEAQINFFVSKDTSSLLLRWLRELGALFTNADIRILALALYRILVNLALYIACIQPEDINNAKVKLNEVFNLIQTHLDGLRNLVPNMPPKERDQLKKLLDDLKKELNRVVANGEDAAKNNYVKALKTCIELLTSLNL